MTPSRHLNKDQKKIFRDLVAHATEIKTFHDVDRYQIEQAAVCIDRIRNMTVKINTRIDPEIDDLNLKQAIVQEKMENERLRTINALMASLNSTMDKLGISRMKRKPNYPAPKKTGAPPKLGPAAPKKDTEEWLEVLEGGKA